jgi:FkbM family methyltransferase
MSSFSRGIMNMPVVTKLWSKYPLTWKYLLNVGLFIKYKTINVEKLPTSIKLPSSFNLHINPKENRGRALLISNGMTQAHVTKFWERSVLAFSPTTVLDIGVNYGECLFSIKYSDETKIYGVEANGELIHYINKSMADHPNKNQMKIIHAFASNQKNKSQEFYIDKNWSGTSSGSDIYPKMVEKHLVKTITVDSFLKELDVCQERILFKIDVEGFESFVLEGMEHVINQTKSMLGIIEFDSEYIQKSGTNLDSFLTNLASNFHVYLIDSLGELHLLTEVTLENLQHLFNSKGIHTDLVLTKSDFDAQKMKYK